MTRAAAMIALLMLSACGDRRTPKQKAFSDCVYNTAKPTDCAEAIDQIYGDNQNGKDNQL